jgi:hypothetical protein
LIAYCLNDACRHQAWIDKSAWRPPRGASIPAARNCDKSAAGGFAEGRIGKETARALAPRYRETQLLTMFDEGLPQDS